jgi:hypothetical protein
LSAIKAAFPKGGFLSNVKPGYRLTDAYAPKTHRLEQGVANLRRRPLRKNGLSAALPTSYDSQTETFGETISCPHRLE